MAIAEERLTLEQFLSLPEEKPALEFAEGEVTQKVSPKGFHSSLQVELIVQLSEVARSARTARVYSELRVTFAGASRVPDVSVFRWKRIPVGAGGEVAQEFTEPPDIAIEIASPEQRVSAIVRRCLWYVANGVQIALLVDPADRSVLAFRPEQATVAWRGADRIDLSDILPDLHLTVEALFATLRVDEDR